MKIAFLCDSRSGAIVETEAIEDTDLLVDTGVRADT